MNRLTLTLLTALAWGPVIFAILALAYWLRFDEPFWLAF